MKPAARGTVTDTDEREFEILRCYRRLQDLEQWFAQRLAVLARDKQEELQLLRRAQARAAMPKLIKTKWGVLFARGNQMKILYADDEYVCQTVIWPPRNAERGWELDVLCSQELLGMFPHMSRRTFRVDDIEFTGLEMIAAPIVTSADEMARVTLIFQHCVTAETDKVRECCSHG